jgi:signal transduction histidine kinase
VNTPIAGQGNSNAAVPLESLNRLAVSIIHEVSNPLSVIIGNAQYILLRRHGRSDAGSDGDEVVGTLQAILNESVRLAGLVNQLVDFSSRITAEAPSPSMLVVELERLLNVLRASGTGESDG